MLEIIHGAGWPIWLLLLTSVFGLALIIERFLSLRSRQLLPPGLLQQVIEMVHQRKDTPEALSLLATGSALGRVLAEVVAASAEPEHLRQAAIEDVGADVSHRLNRYLPALGTIAVIGPLLGLFGTVVGMIEIFGAYSPTGADPSQLARGISIALYNTGFGILIAIPALIFHSYFRSRVENFLHQMERQASRLNRILDKERPHERT